jgi:aspartyl-tRNA(Asn)/glutamyl-tRNA(Gln) amidotransferase subunit C
MISTEEIKKLADLARIEIDDNEVEKLGGEMGAILEYVGQVKEIAGNAIEKIEVGENRNVLRNDENPTASETHSKELIAEFPESENNYLKVKKIL